MFTFVRHPYISINLLQPIYINYRKRKQKITLETYKIS